MIWSLISLFNESKKHWLRQPEIDKEFPKPKYYFGKYLREVGDYIETDPCSYEDYRKLNKAVFFWAWYHEKHITTMTYKTNLGLYVMRIELISKHRKVREYT